MREREKSEINCLLPKMVTGDLSVKESSEINVIAVGSMVMVVSTTKLSIS